MMKNILEPDFREALAEQLNSANFHLRSDISGYLHQISGEEKDADHRKIIEIFRENNEIAGRENRAVCQDTGYVQIYVKLGNRVFLNFDLCQAAESVVSDFYEKNDLRKSIAHPVSRINTRTNTPAFFNIELAMGDQLEVWIMLKGGGSENVSRAGFLLPTDPTEKIEDWVVETVKNAGAKACPPYVIGVGVGGNLEKAVANSKKALLERIDENHMDPQENDLAEKMKVKINRLPIGFQGLRFGETAISVKVKTMPCHIATLPVAVSIGCNAVRQGYFIL